MRTWYVRRLATSDGLVAASAPAEELRNAARAWLLGARIVISVALLRADTIPGWVARRLFKVLSDAFWEARAAARL